MMTDRKAYGETSKCKVMFQNELSLSLMLLLCIGLHAQIHTRLSEIYGTKIHAWVVIYPHSMVFSDEHNIRLIRSYK